MGKYLVGSKLLGLGDNRDMDYIVLIEDNQEENYHKYEQKDEIEYFYRSKSMLDRYQNFEMPFDFKTVRYYIVNYQLDENIVGQDFPLKCHILDRRNNYINLLNWIVDNQALNFKKNHRLNHGNCSKIIYHIAYTIFILENNSTTLTAEQKAIVQQIHDLQMSQEYLDVLAEKIKNLK